MCPTPPTTSLVGGAPAFVCTDPWPMQLQLARVEIDAFATCASEMTYFHPFGGPEVQVPRMEHFANGYDLVARLGLTASHPEKWPIHIDGPRYVRRGARGGPAPFERVDGGDPQATPRLFESMGGGVPAS